MVAVDIAISQAAIPRQVIEWHQAGSGTALAEENGSGNLTFQRYPTEQHFLLEKLKQGFLAVPNSAAISPEADFGDRSGTAITDQVTTRSIANISYSTSSSVCSIISGAGGAASASEATQIPCTTFVTTFGGIGFVWATTSNAATDTPVFSQIRKITSSVTAAQPTATPPVTSTGSALVVRIGNERHIAEIDDEYADVADAAVRDAVTLLQHAMIAGTPRVMFSDDGILTLQWRRGDLGVALIFAGDGMASIAFKRPGQFYAENGIEVAVSGELPRSFYDALAATSA